MYKNLKAEMLRQDVNISQIAKAINKSERVTYFRLNGTIKIKLDESRKIAALFKENNSIEYLFQTKE